MKKNLVSIVAGITFLVSTAGFSYVGCSVINGYRTSPNLTGKERIVLGVSLASLVPLGYCLHTANREKLK